MGRIYEALERQKKEKAIITEDLFEKKVERLVIKDRESAFAREFCTQFECSPKVVALSAPDSVDAESFRLLRAQILFAGGRKRPRTIMVAGAFPGEGKTFVAANLAVSMALGIDEYVLLVDCDLRRPQLHEMLGYTRTVGLHEYLTGKKQLSDLIIRTKIDKLSMLTAGNVSSNASELLSSSMMEEFLEEVKGRYEDRFIVIDTAPSQITAEANVLAKYVDGIILVVMAQKSPREAIQKSIHNLGKEKILGIVFNGYSQAYKGYQKHYRKYYYGK